MTSIKKLAIRGTIWTLISYGLGNFLRLFSNLLLTRMLFPEAFGLMALVTTVLVGLHLFSDIGFGPNIIQNKRGDDPNFLNTAWTLQIIRSSIIWVATVVLAVPAAHFYNQPALVGLFPVVGLTTLIDGFQSTSVYTLSRHLNVRTLQLLGLTQQVISITVMLLWARVNPSVWAIAAGSIAGSLFRLTWSHLILPDSKNRLRWEPEAVRELISFGKWIFFSTAATFLALQADRLILGKLIPLEVLGTYSIALGLAELPKNLISNLSSNVVLPAISKMTDRPRPELRQSILKHRQLILLGAAVMVALLASFGDVVVRVLYDNRYAQGAWILPLLAFGLWPNILHESIRQALIAVGQPKYEATGQFLKCITVSVGIPIGFYLGERLGVGGLLGAVLVVVINDLPLYGPVSYGLRNEGLSVVRQDLLISGLFVALIGVIVSVRWLLGFGFPLSMLFQS